MKKYFYKNSTNQIYLYKYILKLAKLISKGRLALSAFNITN